MKKHIDVAAAIIIQDGRLFAARRRPGVHLAGYWELPGGKLETSETAEQCLERELQEELNIVARIGEFFGESTHDYGAKIVRLFVYLVEHVSGNFELVAHDEFRWLPLDQIDSVKWAPADIAIVEQYSARASVLARRQQ